MFCALKLYNHVFESTCTSSRCVATLDKLLTHNCLVGRRRETTSLISSPGGVKANEPVFGQKTIPRQQKFRAMNGAHLASAIGESLVMLIRACFKKNSSLLIWRKNFSTTFFRI